MTERPRIIPLRLVASEWQVSRRQFLRGMGAAAAVAAGLGLGCDLGEDDGWDDLIVRGELPEGQRPPVMPPFPPETRPDPGELRFFTESEAATLDALLATILPSDDESPGAREAQVLNYIDFRLSEYEEGFGRRVFRQPPYAQPYDGDEPPGPNTDEVIWVPRDELPRYGYQSGRNPQEIYRDGLAEVDALARSEFGAPLGDLGEADQEALVAMMAEESGDVDEGLRQPSLNAFFDTVRQDLVEGMFSDPQYGGNAEFIGWRLIGYPGAQRAYTPDEMHTLNHFQERQVQGLAELHASNPGLHADHGGRPPAAGPRDGRVPPTDPTLEPESRRRGGASSVLVASRTEWLCRF